METVVVGIVVKTLFAGGGFCVRMLPVIIPWCTKKFVTLYTKTKTPLVVCQQENIWVKLMRSTQEN